MNKSAPKFTREQNVWMAEVILVAVFDRIESSFPCSIRWEDRIRQQDGGEAIIFTDYESGALETAGMALAVLYAQQTDDGLGIGDAMTCAGEFDEVCFAFLKKVWANKGEDYKKQHDARLEKGSFQIADLYNAIGGYPDPAKHAEEFVKRTFDQFEEAKAAQAARAD